jgi:hypothetical protein
MAITTLPNAKKYVIKQLINGTQLQILHPETDAYVVRFLDVPGVYGGGENSVTNVGAILASGVLNPGSTAQTKIGNLTVNGTLTGGNLVTAGTLTFDGASYDKTIQLGLGGNSTYNLPNKESGTFTLATMEDINVVDGIFDLDYTNGVISVSPYASGVADLTWVGTNTNGGKFYLGEIDPLRTDRLNLNAVLFTSGLDVSGNVAVSNNATLGGTLEVDGLSKLDGGIAVETNKFTVDVGGNTSIAGTLGVTGNTTLVGALNANGGINANDGLFTVGSGTGDVLTQGTLTVQGDKLTSLGGDLTVADAADTILGGKLTVKGLAEFREDLSVGVFSGGNFTSKFTVDQATGNTLLSGDISIGGNVSLSGGYIFCDSPSKELHIGSKNLSPDGAKLFIGSESIVNPANAAYTASRTIFIGSNGALGTDTTVNIGSPLEDPAHSIINLYGTVNVFGGTGSIITTETLNVTDNEIVLNSGLLGGAIPSTSGVVVNRGYSTYIAANDPANVERPDATLYWDESNQRWDASTKLYSPAIQSGGSLIAAGDLSIGAGGKFAVDSISGNTSAAGTLTVAGLAKLSGGIEVDNQNTFSVADGSGNTIIGGTLNVAGTTDVAANFIVSGNYSATISGTLTANGATTLNNTLTVGPNHATDLGGSLTVAKETFLEGDLEVINLSGETPEPAFFVDSGTGNTIVYGTLGVKGTSLFENDVVIKGGAGIDFSISNGSTTKFSVDSTNGNVIGGRYNGLAITGGLNSLTYIGANGSVFVDNNASLSVSYPTVFGNNYFTINDGLNTRRVELDANLYVGGSGTGLVAISSNDSSTKSVTLESSVTVRALTEGYVLYAPSANTIASEQHLNATRGGTGFGSYTVGDILYANSTSSLDKLAKGSNGTVLTVIDGVPQWAESQGNLDNMTSLTGQSWGYSNSTAFSAVVVNEKGLVTQAAQFLQVGNSTSVVEPATSLVVGGLFFQEIAA